MVGICLPWQLLFVCCCFKEIRTYAKFVKLVLLLEHINENTFNTNWALAVKQPIRAIFRCFLNQIKIYQTKKKQPQIMFLYFATLNIDVILIFLFV